MLRKRIIISIVLGCSQHSLAMEFERPVVEAFDAEHQLKLWGEYDRFDSQMDFIGYSDSFAPTAARINYIFNQRLGIIYAPLDGLQLAYTYNRQEDDVTRFREPKYIHTKTTGHHFKAQYSYSPFETVTIAAEVGLRQHKGDKVDFYKYDFIGSNVNVQVTWPGHALVSLEGDDKAYLAALRAKYENNGLRISLGAEQRNVRISALMYSAHPLIEAMLAKEAPQKEPWTERHRISQLSLDYDFLGTWSIAMDLQHYDITRTDYIPRKNKVDYNSNDTLDMYISWQMTEYLKPYVHGHASRRFTLGQIPFAYTTRSNHKFANPFGYLSAGLQFEF